MYVSSFPAVSESSARSHERLAWLLFVEHLVSKRSLRFLATAYTYDARTIDSGYTKQWCQVFDRLSKQRCHEAIFRPVIGEGIAKLNIALIARANNVIIHTNGAMSETSSGLMCHFTTAVVASPVAPV